MENILDIRAANCIHLFSTNLHDQCFDSCQSNWFLRLLRIPFIFHLPLGPCFSFHFPSFWAAHGAVLFPSFSFILGCLWDPASPFIFHHFGVALGPCFSFHFPSFWAAPGPLLFLSFSFILGRLWDLLLNWLLWFPVENMAFSDRQVLAFWSKIWVSLARNVQPRGTSRSKIRALWLWFPVENLCSLIVIFYITF